MDQGENEKELEPQNTSSFLDKLKERQLYVIIIGVVAVLFIAAIIYGIFYTNSNDVADQDLAADIEETTDDNENVNDSEVDDTAVVLPQKVRFEEGGSATGSMIDPFVGPMKLTGIATGGYGGSMAIVESSGTSYIVTVGDYVDDLWAVYEITHERVVLRVHDQEVSLFFDQPPEIRNLERGFVEDDNDNSREGDE
ncbi:MAG: hypothetical protein R6U08_08100 [Bacillota bacterium]